MQRRNDRFLVLLAVVLLLMACNGNGREGGAGPMDGDQVGPGMMRDQDGADVVEPGMMDEEAAGQEVGPGMMNGSAWGDGAFESNGERIYFTGTSERGGAIDYSGGPDTGAMMMGGRLSCASCHGPNARGGVHTMHGMHGETMNAPNIRWDALAGHGVENDDHGAADDDHAAEDNDRGQEGEGYSMETFRMAVVDGEHPHGTPLSEEMPRSQMSDADLRDLAAYLQSLTGE